MTIRVGLVSIALAVTGLAVTGVNGADEVAEVRVSASTLGIPGPATWAAADYDGRAFAADQPDLTSLPTVHVVYMHAADKPSRFTQLAPMIQAENRRTSRLFASATGRGVRWDERLGADGNRYQDITVVKSSQRYNKLSSSSQFSLTSQELSKLRLNNPNKKYLVWLDAGSAFCGQSHNPQDVQRNINNAANKTTTSTVYTYYDRNDPRGGFCAAQFHELTHAFGGVQDVAPHANAGHCNDNGNDVMCHGASTIPYDPANPDRYYDYNNDDYLDLQADPTYDPATATGGKPVKLGFWAVNLSKFLCAESDDPNGVVGCGQPNNAEY